MKTTNAKITDLHFDDKNANKHTQKGLRLVEKSLSKLGAGRSILIDKNNNIIAGNGVIETAGQIGMDNIRIVETDGKEIVAVKRTDIDINSKKGRELAIIDNHSAKESIDLDFDVINDLVSEYDISPVEWELESIDWNNNNEEAVEDNFEIPDKIETNIKRGDVFNIYKDGKLLHRVMCGDSTNSDDVAKLMNGEKAEILFTSPPYSDMRDYNGDKNLDVDYISNFIIAWNQFTDYQVVNLGIQRKNHNIYQYWDEYIEKAKECGYLFLAWNVWVKQNAGSIGNQSAFFPISHEWIFVFGYKFKDINRTWEKKSPNEKCLTKNRRQADGSIKKSTYGVQEELKEMESVLYCDTELGSIRSLHPATFPIKLPSEYIKAMTNNDDIISDCFLGSGTTLIAAHQLNRRCYGMEIDEQYCQVILDRIKNFDNSIEIK